MSEAELARDLHAVLAKVRQGTEIVIEQDHRAVAVLKPSEPTRPGRTLNECIALAHAWEAGHADVPVPDADFASDIQAGIDARRDSLDPALLSESALAVDWSRPEEDEAWSHLQRAS